MRQVQYRIDMGALSPKGPERTPQGGLRLPANLTRTGIFKYHQTDGSVVRELRHPDEVFNAASLATLADAPLTLGHPGMVTPKSWKKDSIGHVRDAAPDGIYVASTVIVQDADAVTGVERKDLVELSCGYSCDLVTEKGVYDGEEYDARQTNIRYNHVGIGPKNWGRAGSEVRVRLDGAGNCYIGDMLTDEQIAQLRADAAEAATLRADNVRLTAERDTLQAQADTLRTDAAAIPAQVNAQVQARVIVLDGARKVLGTVDATKSNDELIAAVLVKADSKFDAKDRSPEYLRAKFDFVVDGYVATDAALTNLQAAPTPEKDVVFDAQSEMLNRNSNAWKGK